MPQHEAMAQIALEHHGILAMMTHALTTIPFWFSIAGKKAAGPLSILLERKYFIDEFYSWFFASGARGLGRGLWKFGDVKMIDGFFVNGTARVVAGIAVLIRRFQSGYIYHYAFTMIVGVFVLMSFWLSGS